MKFLTPLTLVAALVGVTLAYKDGAPVSACATMFPSGHKTVAQPSTALPYEFRLGATCYKENMEIPVVVTLKECMDTYFEGLFVQARTDNNMESFGVFDAGADSQLKTLNCSNKVENALTHTDSKHYMCKNFTWTAPAEGMEAIKFQMTIARNKATFWTEVKSAALVYKADCTPMAMPPACQTYDETTCMTEDPSGAATLGMTSLAMLLTALTASFCLGY